MLKTALRQRMNTKPASAGAEQRERGGIGTAEGQSFSVIDRGPKALTSKMAPVN
jgi:hypothetical protein